MLCSCPAEYVKQGVIVFDNDDNAAWLTPLSEEMSGLAWTCYVHLQRCRCAEADKVESDTKHVCDGRAQHLTQCRACSSSSCSHASHDVALASLLEQGYVISLVCFVPCSILLKQYSTQLHDTYNATALLICRSICNLVEISFLDQISAVPPAEMPQHLVCPQVEVDYQGGGSYKRKYRVREIIPRGPFDITFKNEQVGTSTVRSVSCVADRIGWCLKLVFL